MERKFVKLTGVYSGAPCYFDVYSIAVVRTQYDERVSLGATVLWSEARFLGLVKESPDVVIKLIGELVGVDIAFDGPKEEETDGTSVPETD